MGTPLFSIVIPTCDRPRLLQHTLRAALRVNHPSYEIVVSDNFSSEETARLVAEMGGDRVRYFRTTHRLPMPDNWQHGYDRSTGRYVTILCDDDGIVPSSLQKLERIIDATGTQLMTWRNFGYYHPDWPSAMRNSVMIGAVTRNVSLVASAYMLQKANTLAHTAMFEFPHGSRFCFSRELGESVRNTCGRIFDIPYPDFTSSMYMLAATYKGCYAYYDGPVTFTTYSYNSNSAIVLGRKKRNTQRTEAFYGDFSSPLYAHVPLKSNLIWNGIAECVLRMQAFFDLPPELKAFDYPNYFLTCYRSIVSDDLSDVVRSKAELLQELDAALSAQNTSIQQEFKRLKDESQRRRRSLRPRASMARDLAENLPRGFKEAIKASRLVRRAARAFAGTTIAVSGDDQGFSNLAELCERMETIVAGDEPFMSMPERDAERSRDS